VATDVGGWFLAWLSEAAMRVIQNLEDAQHRRRKEHSEGEAAQSENGFVKMPPYHVGYPVPC
jgi:hypothetical protein